ncbi:hypothetical protein LM12_0197A [Staphylococcus phage vB_SauM_LM12]|uniref:Uncharacterized protein n=1 Tax=Staphylococcus phage qdsa002 TaxID=1970746 RepID=A0A1X9SIV4_9CAUD|nr:hypothetical protein qdsa002_45 [Staphylococcus phage qdsa002]AUV57079.1 hypothetical protein LM12_0197A [Staphylococcus phage vB_SauM_LM12]
MALARCSYLVVEVRVLSQDISRTLSLKVKPTAHNGLTVGSNPAESIYQASKKLIGIRHMCNHLTMI